MKKILFVFLTLIMLISICSCTSPVNSDVKKADNQNQQQSEDNKNSDDKNDKNNEVIAKVGETLDYKGIKFTLDSVSEYVDDSEFQADKPEEGKMFIMLSFTVSNETQENAYINMFNEDSYCDDISIEPKILFGAKGDNLWGDVASGKKRQGFVAYEVSKDWSTLEFHYKPETFSDSNKMMFKVSNSDLESA